MWQMLEVIQLHISLHVMFVLCSVEQDRIYFKFRSILLFQSCSCCGILLRQKCLWSVQKSVCRDDCHSPNGSHNIGFLLSCKTHWLAWLLHWP